MNVAPLIYNVSILDDNHNHAILNMELSIGQQGSVSAMLVTQEIEKILAKRLKILSVHREELF